MGRAVTFLCAAASGRKILPRIRATDRAVYSLRLGRLSLSERTLAAATERAGGPDFLRQSSRLGHSTAEMGLWRLDQSRARARARSAHRNLGLRKFRMLVAAQYFRQSQRRTRRTTRGSPLGRRPTAERSTTSGCDVARELA